MNSKTTFVTVNPLWGGTICSRRLYSKTTFVTVNQSWICRGGLNNLYSKTTFVTVNPNIQTYPNIKNKNSKTTFVTVNLPVRLSYTSCLIIQKQRLLLLISLVIAYQSTSGEFKNNVCYC